tara:strand:- start:4140 stop:4559 length:420 start_codon:yes stop_codon:yes gene_type:complete
MAKVLLIEDDDGDAMIIESQLRAEDSNCDVRRAHGGAHAFEMLKTDDFCPDVILLDLNMPGLNGHEILRELRQDPRFERTPIVILTTSSCRTDVVKAYEACASAYVVKPVTLDAFGEAVRTIHKFWTETALLPGTATHA